MLKKIMAMVFTPIAFITLALTGCTPPESQILVAHLRDGSTSFLDNPEQVALMKTVCHSIGRSIPYGSYYVEIWANGSRPLSADPKKIQSQRAFHGNCNQPVTIAISQIPQGTPACHSAEMMLAVMNDSQYQPLVPLIFLQIEANEQEKFCPKTWQTLAAKVEQRGGHLLIIGTEDIPGHNFKRELWENLHTYSSVSFVEDKNAAVAIQQIITEFEAGNKNHDSE